MLELEGKKRQNTKLLTTQMNGHRYEETACGFDFLVEYPCSTQPVIPLGQHIVVLERCMLVGCITKAWTPYVPISNSKHLVNGVSGDVGWRKLEAIALAMIEGGVVVKCVVGGADGVERDESLYIHEIEYLRVERELYAFWIRLGQIGRLKTY